MTTVDILVRCLRRLEAEVEATLLDTTIPAASRTLLADSLREEADRLNNVLHFIYGTH
jgi:hypothetical protein